MNAFSRSWAITKLSFGVINADREMLLFPLLGGIFSALYAAAVMVPTYMVVGALGRNEALHDTTLYVGLFALYFGLAFVATFFNTCTVYTSKVRFEGGDATFGQSLSFALSRIHLIFLWSLTAASVGLLLRMLDRAAERSGQMGQLILGIVTSVLGLAWSVITIFVVPAMVFRGVGPIDAIKHSTQVLKKTWGESLIRHYGLGLAQFCVLAIGVVPLIALLVLTGGGMAAGVLLSLGVLYVILVTLVFSLANTVFNTALYIYAESGQLPSGYDRDLLQGAIGHR